jgi:hypothetical protein
MSWREEEQRSGNFVRKETLQLQLQPATPTETVETRTHMVSHTAAWRRLTYQNSSDSLTGIMTNDTQGSGPVPVSHLFDTILILDFGSQYSHLITRRLREINVYAEMLPCTQKISELSWKPKGTSFQTALIPGIILSGSPYSVYADDAPHADPALFDLGVCLF